MSVQIDPGSRSDGWRAVVRRGLEHAEAGAGDRSAVGAAVERARGALLNGDPRRLGRGVIGFLDAARRPERPDVWFTSQVPPPHSLVVCERRPFLRPLVQLLDDGGPFGIAAVSAERVRIWEWYLGGIREVVDWDYDIDHEDWRETKGPRQRDPANAQTPSSSGRDQYERRLAVHRERMLETIGEHAAEHLKRYRSWRELLCFGPEASVRAFREGLGKLEMEVEHRSEAMIVGEEAGELSRRIGSLVPELNRRRELALVERAREATQGGGAGALGPQDTTDALAEARVAHLLFDATLDAHASRVDGRLVVGADGGEPEPHFVEHAIELAIGTSAEVTPVEGEAAQALAEHDGMAALLRY